MQFYPIKLTAGEEFHQRTSGRIFLIDNIIGAASVDVTLLDNSGSPRQIMPGRKVLFKCVTEFSGVILKSDSDCVVWIFISFDDVSNGYADGGNVSVPGGVKITNTPAEKVPVEFPAGTNVNMTATNVGINNNDAAAVPVRNQALSTFVHQAAVSVGVAATALVSDATLKKIIIRNAHATATVAIGGAGVTLANGPIVLLPGDMWEEKDAAGAAWFAISDTAATNVQVMGVK